MTGAHELTTGAAQPQDVAGALQELQLLTGAHAGAATQLGAAEHVGAAEQEETTPQDGAAEQDEEVSAQDEPHEEPFEPQRPNIPA